MFFEGQKVVCIKKDNWYLEGTNIVCRGKNPVYNEIVTIDKKIYKEHGELHFILKEYKGVLYKVEGRFKPLAIPKTDISIFQKILDDVNKKVSEKV